MGEYKEFAAKKKRQKRNNNLARMLLVLLLLVLLAVAAFIVMQIVRAVQPEPDLSEPQSNVPPSSTSDLPVANASSGAWNTLQIRTENLKNEIEAPDYRMFALPVNGKVSRAYFDDCMFVGDSISQGLAIYEPALHDSYAAGLVSICAYKNSSPKTFLDDATAPDPGNNRVPVWTDLTSHRVPKHIYILLGTNAIVSSMSDEAILKYYGDFLDKLQDYYGPYGVDFYVQMITPVTASTAVQRPKMDNDRIRQLNNYIAKLARERGMYVIDTQEALPMENGALSPEVAQADGTHLKPAGYALWVDYLQYHTAYNPANPYEIDPAVGLENGSGTDVPTVGASGTLGQSGIGASGTLGQSGIGASGAA